MSRRRTTARWLSAAAIVLLSAVALAQSGPQTGGPLQLWPPRPGPDRTLTFNQAQGGSAPQFVPNQVIVQFRAGTDVIAVDSARASVNATEMEQISGTDTSLQLLTTPLSVPDAIAALQALPEVEFAEPNWILRHYATSNDPFFTGGSLFGMYGDGSSPANQFGSQAAEAWAKGFTGSNTVYVGVIDEGIDFNHPDLAANIWTNPFDPVDGVDNDGNGRVDDIHGWDFFTGDNSVYDGSASNTSLDAHGTHVAGTIGAVGGNGVGVAGVNWNVTIISGKFLGPVNGTTAGATAAVKYMTDLKTRHGLNIVATNNSWGGGDYSEALHQAIIQAAKQGILFVAAAGNGGTDKVGDNNDTVDHYPSNYQTNVSAGSESAASYDAVIAVASITSAGALSSFSNFGATRVDIGAPGSGIISTTPQNGYQSFSGTSMATPHVTGAVALYKSINSAASAAQMRSGILDQGISTSSLLGKTATGRRLNVGDFTTLVNLTINDTRVKEEDSGTRNATFTVSLSEPSVSAITLNYGTVDVTGTSGASVANSSAISIPSSGNASPYPSTLTVASGLGTITKLTVRLSGFTHTFSNDVDVLLVGPTGQSVVLMSDVGGSSDSIGVNLTFADGGPALTSSPLETGTYRPTNLADGIGGDSYAAPAPGTPYGTTLAGFNGTDPAGSWRLFVVDDAVGDSGSLSGGWSLVVSTTGGDYVLASGTVTLAAGSTSQTISVTVNGDTTVESSETFKVTLSDVSGANLTDGEGVATIVNDDFTDASLTGVVMKAVHITELRTAINEARVSKGLSEFSFTDAPLTATSTVIRAIHIAEMRTALGEAYTAASQIPPTYTDPVVTAGVTVIKAAHITELRQGVTGLD